MPAGRPGAASTQPASSATSAAPGRSGRPAAVQTPATVSPTGLPADPSASRGQLRRRPPPPAARPVGSNSGEARSRRLLRASASSRSPAGPQRAGAVILRGVQRLPVRRRPAEGAPGRPPPSGRTAPCVGRERQRIGPGRGGHRIERPAHPAELRVGDLRPAEHGAHHAGDLVAAPHGCRGRPPPRGPPRPPAPARRPASGPAWCRRSGPSPDARPAYPAPRGHAPWRRRKGSSARPRKSFWYWSCQPSTKANSPVSRQPPRRHRSAGSPPPTSRSAPAPPPRHRHRHSRRGGPRRRAARPSWCGRRRNRPGGRGCAAPAARARNSPFGAPARELWLFRKNSIAGAVAVASSRVRKLPRAWPRMRRS